MNIGLLSRWQPFAAAPDADPVAVVRAYLSTARTASAKALAAKAAVLIEPQQLAGKIVWPLIIP